MWIGNVLGLASITYESPHPIFEHKYSTNRSMPLRFLKEKLLDFFGVIGLVQITSDYKKSLHILLNHSSATQVDDIPKFSAIAQNGNILCLSAPMIYKQQILHFEIFP